MNKTLTQEQLRQVVVDYYNEHNDVTNGNKLKLENVHVTWFSKELQNCKAVITTDIPDNMYYELTYSGNKQELYLDVYRKWENVCIKVGLGRGNEPMIMPTK